MTDPWTAPAEPLCEPCLRERLTIWLEFALWLIGRRRLLPAMQTIPVQAATRPGDKAAQHSPMKWA